MAGPVEEGAKVATAIVDSMKSQPVTLSLLAFNLLFTTLVFLGSKDFRANQLKLMTMMIELTGESQRLLSVCVAPGSSPSKSGDDRRGENSRDGFKPASAETTLIPLPPLRPLTQSEP